MKCDLIQTRVSDLFDEQISPDEKKQLLNHIDQCEDCRRAYEDYMAIATVLKSCPAASGEQEQIRKIFTKIEEGNLGKNSFSVSRNLWQRTIRIAVSVTLILGLTSVIIYLTTLRNPARAADNILEKSIRAMTSLKTVYMVFAIRTGENENFESIDPTAGFINFRIWKEFGDTSRWRFDKPGRSIIMDGQSQYMIQKTGGYILKGSPYAGFINWMKLFLDPMKILEKELNYAETHRSYCLVKDKGNQIELIVKAPAKGEFSNPWALNASIPEANTRRIYSFNKESHLLTAMTIFVETEQEEICVIKLKEISLNPSLPDSLFIFRNSNGLPLLTLEEWDLATSRGIKSISGEEFARIFFTACGNGDWTTVQQCSPLFSIQGGKEIKALQNRFKGVRVLHIGNGFTSGMFAGMYIPYRILLKSGDTLANNLAIRNDNSFHTWSIDGGF